MAEEKITEKIYCYDHPSAYNNNDAALVAAMCNKGHHDNPMAMAAMMGGGFGANQWMNNPFAYMMMMAWMRMFNGDWNGNGQNAQNIEMQSQLQAIRTQLQDNENTTLLRQAIGDGFNRNDFALSQLAQNLNVDFNSLKDCCCQVQAQIQSVAGQIGFSAERVINAVNMGDCNVIQALKDCCCSTQRQIADFRGDISLQMCQQTNTLERSLDFVNRSVERGFAASSYETQRQTCDIITAGNANTQRIIDTLKDHWTAEQALQIQDLKAKNSNLEQTQTLLAAIRRNNGCGCGCGCNDNCGNY